MSVYGLIVNLINPSIQRYCKGGPVLIDHILIQIKLDKNHDVCECDPSGLKKKGRVYLPFYWNTKE